MIGRRPEPVPGMEPGRWRVTWARGLPQTVRNKWVVSRGNCAGSVQFATWREAMAYADRMARTREYVLPRPNSTWFERPVWELGDGLVVHQSIADQDLTITADYPRMSIPNSKRREFALALLALAEQEEHE